MNFPGWGDSLVELSSGRDRDEPTTDDLLRNTLEIPWQRLHAKLEGETSNYNLPVIELMTMGCAGSGGNAIMSACNAVCTDASAMFGSWQATWNCLSLAAVWQATAVLSDDFGPYLTATVSDEIYAKYGFNMTTFAGKDVLNNTYECAQASCRDDGASCAFSLPSRQDFLDDEMEWSLTFNSSFCEGVKAEANPDIAGPGIYMALMLQSTIALYIWLFSLFLRSRTIIDCAVSPILAIRHRRHKTQKPAQFTISRPKLDGLVLSIEQANLAHATRSLAAEFGEAQCFFVIAIAVAIIYADSQGASFNGAGNWLSVRLNQQMASSICFYASIPTILVQVALGLMSMDSIYSLVLSTVSIILASVASTLTGKDPDVTRVRNMLTKDEAIVGLPECGNNPSLRAFCGGAEDSSGYRNNDLDGSSHMWPWLALLGYLWCLKFRHHLRQRARLYFSQLQQAAHGSVTWTQILFHVRRLVWLCHVALKPFILPLAQLFLVPLMAMCFIGIVDEIKDSSRVDSDRSWTLGQVIAMLVWAPVIAKYMYTSVFGLENGFSIRLSEPYSVQKDISRRMVPLETTAINS